MFAFIDGIEVEYTIDIHKLTTYLCAKNPHITHDVIWTYFRNREWGGQDSFYEVTYDDLIDKLWDMIPVGEPDPEDMDDFAALPITDEMEPEEILYRTVLLEMMANRLPDEFLIKIWW